MPIHHYVPKFYLKRWLKDNTNHKLASGKYCPAAKRIKWTRHAPSGTGYEPNLYGNIEEKFFSPLDNDASNVLGRLESGHSQGIVPLKLDMGVADHECWAKFILGFIIRTPAKVKTILDGFKSKDLDEDIARDNIPNIICNPQAINDLKSLTWIFASVNTSLELITCDNPLIFKPNSLSHPNCVIILPMSPKHFFLATNKENIDGLEKDPRKMVTHINAGIIKNADIRIYAKSTNSITDAFLKKHWPIR